MDVTPDYSKFSSRELRDVAARIDKAKYPDRYAWVTQEIECRETLGDDTATAPKKKLVTVWDFFSVLFAMTGGAILGAVLSGIGAYLINPPYGPKYGDGIGWGLGFIGCLLFGTIIGAIIGLSWGIRKIRKR